MSLTLSKQDFARLRTVVRRLENEPQRADGVIPEFADEPPTVEQFLIASDVTQYAPGSNDSSAPTGYDSFAIGFPLRAGCDAAKLPILPELATLIGPSNNQAASLAPRGAVLDWPLFKWVGQYADEVFGRPVLINCNKLFRGYVFRGEIVAALSLPGMLHSFGHGGTFQPWAPSAGNVDRLTSTVETAYKLDAGWCAIGTGHQVLDVEIETAVLRPSTVTLNQAKVRHLRDPKPAEGASGDFTIWFACAELPQPPMQIAQQFKVAWNQTLYRWELIPNGSSILVKPASNIAKGASGVCNIYAGTQGSETATGDTLTAYARAAAITTTKWGYAGLVNGRLEVVPADC